MWPRAQVTPGDLQLPLTTQMLKSSQPQHSMAAQRGVLAVSSKISGVIHNRAIHAMLSAGIIFDSTYSGKAFHALREDIKADHAYWKGRKVTHRST